MLALFTKTHFSKKTPIVLLFILGIVFTINSQNNWTWLKGSNVISAKGRYGIIGVASSTNTPGSRYGALNWTDQNGNLWLYGGFGKDTAFVSAGAMADLWKFDVTLGQWIWISGSNINYQGTNPVYGSLGVPSSSNNPGYRSGSATWTDNAGNLWLFGGEALDLSGTGSCSKNDIWKYNISTNMWTWISGSSSCYPLANYGTKGVMTSNNVPGGRTGMTFWKDLNGDLWILGGFGVINSTTTGDMNDLWKYSVTSNQWVWLSGTNAFNQLGQYGTMGLASGTTIPGARRGVASWVDKNGTFWLFGGDGYDALGNYGGLNDLWKYNPTSNQWTWLRGSNQRNQQPVYGTMNIFSSTSQPGAMSSNGCWLDSTGNTLYIGVGMSINQVNSGFYTNILWKYNVPNNQWSWVKGPNVVADQYGVYGTIGVGSFSTIPGGRNKNSFWIGKNGEFYLFGGFGYGSQSGSYALLNDLWKFNPCYNAAMTLTNTTASTNTLVCGYSTATLSAIGTTTVSWYDAYSNFIATGNTLTVPIGTTNTTYLITDNASCLPTSITVSVLPTPTLNITATNTLLCQGATATLSAISSAAFTSWSNGSSTYSTAVTPSITTTYSVMITNYPWNCTNNGVKTISVAPIPTVSITATTTTVCMGSALSLSAVSSANSYSWNTGITGSVITVTPGSTSVYSVVATSIATGCKGNNSISIYVDPLPTLTITPATSSLCQGASIILSALSGASTFSWSNGSTVASTSVSPQVTTIYTLMVTDSNTGCTKTGIATVSVNPLPSATISASNGSLCAGNSVTLSVIPSANSFSWNNGSTSNSIVVSPSITSTYSVIVTNTANACSNTDATIITALPIPTLSLVASNSIVCPGGSSTLTALAGAVNYSWSNGSTLSVIAVSPSVSSIYTLVITDPINGCTTKSLQPVSISALPTLTLLVSADSICFGTTATLTALSNASGFSWSTGSSGSITVVSPSVTSGYSLVVTDLNTGCHSDGTKTIVVNSVPNLSITASKITLCSGESTSLNVSGATIYNWAGGPTTSSYVINPNFTTTYSVSGTNSSGCTSTDTLKIIVKPLPSIALYNSGTLICSGDSYTISASGASTYTWSNGAQTQNIYFIANITSSFSVIGTSTLTGCTASASLQITVSDCTGMTESEPTNFQISIFPNPAKDKLELRIKNTELIDLKVEIVDAIGKLVKIQTFSSASGILDISSLSAGVYFLHINNHVQKFIKE